jgi:8-oxo-dGTP pyrophosphatase MutT (NUDIX family)
LVDGERGVEVLMVRRGDTARFMGGAWVFPGGSVDPADREPASRRLLDGDPGDLAPWLVAGFREVAEETGVWLFDPPLVRAVDATSFRREAGRLGGRFAVGRAAYFANWITPTMVPVRFDARFFAVSISRVVTPVPDGREVDAAEFVAPSAALQRAGSGRWTVPFPTQRILEQLAGVSDLAAALAGWRAGPVEPIQPRLRIGVGDVLEVVLPGQPGFEQLEDAPPDPAALARAAHAAAAAGRPIPEVADDRG